LSANSQLSAVIVQSPFDSIEPTHPTYANLPNYQHKLSEQLL